MYPLKKIHEHLNGSGTQGNDNAGRSKVLDVIAADVANDINDSSKNIGKGLHRVDAQISNKADHLKIQLFNILTGSPQIGCVYEYIYIFLLHTSDYLK